MENSNFHFANNALVNKTLRILSVFLHIVPINWKKRKGKSCTVIYIPAWK